MRLLGQGKPGTRLHSACLVPRSGSGSGVQLQVAGGHGGQEAVQSASLQAECAISDEAEG